jgi:hypothetical protein
MDSVPAPQRAGNGHARRCADVLWEKRDSGCCERESEWRCCARFWPTTTGGHSGRGKESGHTLLGKIERKQLILVISDQHLRGGWDGMGWVRWVMRLKGCSALPHATLGEGNVCVREGVAR